MSKIVDATCDAEGKVRIAGIEVKDAVIVSAGKQASTGLAIIDEGRVWYLPSSASDISTTIEKTITLIEKLNEALTKIGTTLTAIGGGMTGPTTAPPPTLAADVIEINAKVTALNAVKTELEALKDALK